MLTNVFKTIMQTGLERRRFLSRAGIGTAGLAAAAVSGGIAMPTRAEAAGITDVDIFNFALNFEYLGAEYYLTALGSMLPSSLTLGGGPVTRPTNGQVPFDSEAGGYFAQQLANDEYAHVQVIQEALRSEGGTPIAEPAIDLVNSWTTLAISAGLLVAGQTFDPYASEVGFLVGAYVLEDVCVTALTGAAALITNKTNLAYAGSILGTEGYQVGMIRSRLSALGAGQVTDAISAARSNLANSVLAVGPDDNGTDANGNAFNFTNVDVNGQAYRRTPQQVLAIAYGGGTTGGLFFPNGVNGTITSA